MGNQPVAYVVEDDESFRRALSRMLETSGIAVSLYSSAEEFLTTDHDPGLGCLILDVKLPGLSGLELQEQLRARDNTLPIIFLTGHGDLSMCVTAVKSGADNFLSKPVRVEELVTAVQKAFESNAAMRKDREELLVLRARYERLTDREREVMMMVVAGHLNKESAKLLGITERTIKAHRAQVMSKMEVDSVPDLVRIAQRLGI